MKYSIEVFHPEVMDRVWVVFESEVPFLTISKGVLIDSTSWLDADHEKILRVVSIEHTLSESEHKLSVYAQQVDDSEDVRLDS